jgi:hypothetical protein
MARARYAYLIERMAGVGYDEEVLNSAGYGYPFAVEDVLMNSVWTDANAALVELVLVGGEVGGCMSG